MSKQNIKKNHEHLSADAIAQVAEALHRCQVGSLPKAWVAHMHQCNDCAMEVIVVYQLRYRPISYTMRNQWLNSRMMAHARLTIVTDKSNI